MLKSLYSRHNEIFLHLLRTNREVSQLRQTDLARRLGHGEVTVSKVECGERGLDLIELRTWLMALEMDFVAFIHELDQELKAHPAHDASLLAGQWCGTKRHQFVLARRQPRKPGS